MQVVSDRVLSSRRMTHYVQPGKRFFELLRRRMRDPIPNDYKVCLVGHDCVRGASEVTSPHGQSGECSPER